MLGLDYDQEVSEDMLGFLVVYYEADKSNDLVTVTFNQFLSESSNGHMPNFLVPPEIQIHSIPGKIHHKFQFKCITGKRPENFQETIGVIRSHRGSLTL